MQQPLEYSYFRAAGLSLAAVETVERARAELNKTRAELKRQHKAEHIFAGGDKSFNIRCFVFADAADVPEGWVAPEKITGTPGMILRMPPAGSADHFNLVAIAKRATRMTRNSSLEKFFDLTPFAARGLQAGVYSQRFVRDVTCFAPWQDANRPSPPAHHGAFDQRGLMTGGSKVASGSGGTDPIETLQLNGDWYIRVPNDQEGRARWQPPDAVPMPYDAMLAADAAEYQRRYQRPRPKAPGP